MREMGALYPVATNLSRNQSTVSTAKRLASLFWYLIASTIDTLHNTINAWLWNCMYMELEVQYTCMYDLNKCWFYISKTDCFCFLLTLNCEQWSRIEICAELFCVRFVLHDILSHRYRFDEVSGSVKAFSNKNY